MPNENPEPDSSQSSNDSVKKKMLLEIKEQYNRENALRDTLDDKASKMITVSSGIATLLVGLGTLLISRLEPDGFLFFMDIGILFLGIVLLALSIVFFHKRIQRTCF